MKYVLLFIVTIALALPICINYGLGINLKTLLFQDIYETREVFSNKLTSLQDYSYSWLVKTIIPVTLIFLLINKKYSLAIVSLSLLMYLYLISGNKSVYLTTIVMVMFYFMGRNYLNKIKYFLIMLLIALIFIPLFDLFIVNDIFLRGIIVNRVFFFPSLLTYYYFDFFTDLPMYFSEHTIFNQFFHSPLGIESARKIAKVYFDTNEMYANNGIVSDGFMNLGYLGVAILSFVFSLIFLFFNSLELDKRYYGVFFITIFFVLSIPFFTILVTGGLGILIILAYLIMKPKNRLNF